jgi:asparagine synthetase B (glutamine-hydrolysing)
MCGIFGYNEGKANINKNDKRVLITILAILNDTRGGQSWGVCEIKHESIVKKGLGKIVKLAKRLSKKRTFFAHTRFASHGDVTKDNAHPFEIGDIIGAHNGVLSNHIELNKLHNRTFAVDSQHLFAHINENKDFSDIEGYGAITWFNKKTKTFHICKLEGGSLSVCKVIGKDGNSCIIFSSAYDHLNTALKAARLKGEFFKIEDGKVYTISNGKLYETTKTLTIKPRSKIIDWRQGYLGGGFKDDYMSDYDYYMGNDEYLDDLADDEIKELEKEDRKQEFDKLMKNPFYNNDKLNCHDLQEDIYYNNKLNCYDIREDKWNRWDKWSHSKRNA